MLAERAGVLAALAAVLVLVGELVGAIAWQERIVAPASDRVLTLEATDVVLGHTQMAASRGARSTTPDPSIGLGVPSVHVDDARLRAMLDNLATAQLDVQWAYLNQPAGY